MDKLQELLHLSEEWAKDVPPEQVRRAVIKTITFLESKGEPPPLPLGKLLNRIHEITHNIPILSIFSHETLSQLSILRDMCRKQKDKTAAVPHERFLVVAKAFIGLAFDDAAGLADKLRGAAETSRLLKNRFYLDAQKRKCIARDLPVAMVLLAEFMFRIKLLSPEHAKSEAGVDGCNTALKKLKSCNRRIRCSNHLPKNKKRT